jgi:hypothetical protein
MKWSKLTRKSFAWRLLSELISSDFVVCKLLKNGGSVCESNTPATSKMPPAGFEDRDDHRTACASVTFINMLQLCQFIRNRLRFPACLA